MSAPSSHSTRAPRTRVGLAAAAGVILVVTHLALRFAEPSFATRALQNSLFMLAPVAAAVLFWRAATDSPRGTRERTIWGILAVTLIFLVASEGLLGVSNVFLVRQGPLFARAFDAVNVAAAFGFAALLAVRFELDRMDWSARARTLTDAVVVEALLFAAVYGFAMKDFSASLGVPQLAVRWTAYATLGITIALVLLLASVSAQRFAVRPAERWLTTALGVYSAALLLWPAWDAAFNVRDQPVLAEMVSTTLFLLSYIGLVLTAVARLVYGPWEGDAQAPAPDQTGWGLGYATLLLAAVSALGFVAFRSPVGSDARIIFLDVAMLVAVGLVCRTALVSAEAESLRARALTDAVTGLPNHRCLQERCEELIRSGRRYDVPFALVLIDLDDFRRVNERGGYQSGDLTLAAVGDVLRAVGDSVEGVFRLSGDEFAYLVSGDGSESIPLTTRALEAIRALSIDHAPLTASAGIAVYPEHADDRERLIDSAERAQAWAKLHGKDRLVVFEERIAGASGVEERLRDHERESRLEMARALVAASDARDARNHAHSRNVAALSTLVGRSLGFDTEHLRRLEIAAMLHDVGKIALDDEVLGRSALSPRERLATRAHVELGERLTTALGMEGLPGWIRSHHERWDGGGYPDGLHGEGVPLESRIIALADAYDGMTTGKRWGAPMSKAAALQEIDLGIGSRFQPELAEVFIREVAATRSLGWSDGWPGDR